MPSLFQTGSVPEQPGPKWGVGYRGRSLLSFKPKQAGFILQSQARNREEMAKTQADQVRQDEDMRRLMSQLTPQEQLDAQTFGMDYVQQQRARVSERAYQEGKAADSAAASEAKVKEDAAKKAAGIEARKAQIAGFIKDDPGVQATQDWAQRAQEFSQNPAGKMMPEAPPPRVLDDFTADMIEKELKVPLPAGFIRKSDAEKQKVQEDKDKAEVEKKAKREQNRKIAGEFIGRDAEGNPASEYELDLYEAALAYTANPTTGVPNPKAAVAEVQKHREAKRKVAEGARKESKTDAGKARAERDKNMGRSVALGSEKSKLLTEIAAKKDVVDKDTKAKSKVDVLTDEQKQIKRDRIAEIDAEIARMRGGSEGIPAQTQEDKDLEDAKAETLKEMYLNAGSKEEKDAIRKQMEDLERKIEGKPISSESHTEPAFGGEARYAGPSGGEGQAGGMATLAANHIRTPEDIAADLETRQGIREEKRRRGEADAKLAGETADINMEYVRSATQELRRVKSDRQAKYQMGPAYLGSGKSVKELDARIAELESGLASIPEKYKNMIVNEDIDKEIESLRKDREMKFQFGPAYLGSGSSVPEIDRKIAALEKRKR